MTTPRFSRARMQATITAAVALGAWGWLGGTASAVVLGIASVLAVLAWVAPQAHAPVHRGMERAGRALAVGSSWILLAVAYGGLFVPLRLWRALTRRDPLGLRPDARLQSYLRPLAPGRPRRFDRMY